MKVLLIRRPPGLTIRVTFLVALIILVLLSVYGWLTERSISQHFSEQDGAVLRSSLQGIASVLDTPRGDDVTNSLGDRLDLAVSGHNGLLYRIETVDGTPLLQSDGLRNRLGTLTDSGLSTLAPGRELLWEAAGKNFRGLVSILPPGVENNRPGYRILAAVEIDQHLDFISKCRVFLWSYTTIGTLIGLLAVWGAVVSGLKPLRRMSEQIRGISFEKMDVRLAPKTVPRELSELAASFDHMANRMHEVYRRLANYSADIAHELRSPVTNLKTQTEVALSRARELDEYREVLYSSLEEYDHMSKMIDDMLLLAKTENRLVNVSFAKVELKELLELAEYFECWAEEKGVSLCIEGEPVKVLGEKSMLRRAFSNLISNAVKHTPAGGTVKLTLENDGEYARVLIENPGRQIPPEHLSKLFDRFYRVDPSRHRKGEGVGLGLAIVKSITELHGGLVAVTSQSMLTKFEVRLPVLIPAPSNFLSLQS
ncbi:hypothetical protein BTA51_29570 [Hahella sp. CCB-MM4]|uniref:heavy metal sensor histidine kinase n=1 Tax=Hahella sp. (strain CCB-MM4) TaxID=1926491 RepID=UPI000B9C7229|nr:heavy metal sensor histidine kinase [Hahella sp. CCB-MM4]OZG69774.1 hypothetical protein BTA51_29570 [Hahella sp. CCB-MM4]